jgi:hypothetical protein
MKTDSDGSLRVLLRLVIDEIVEDLSRNGGACESSVSDHCPLSIKVAFV